MSGPTDFTPRFPLRLARLALAFVLILSSLGSAGRAAGLPAALVRIELSGPADVQAYAATGLSIYGRFYPQAGGEILLARLDSAQQTAVQRAGLRLRILDPQSGPEAAYYLLTARDPAALRRAAEYVQVLERDPAWVVGRADDPLQAEAAAALGIELLRLASRPLIVESPPAPALPEAVTPSPIVQGMINQVASRTASSYNGYLSGEYAATVGGSGYKIMTRYSRTEEPIQKATQYVYEHFQSLGLEPFYHEYNLPGTGTRRNVVAEQPGLTQPETIYLVVAHLDSTSQSQYRMTLAPGADDNASGSVGVMIAANILSQYAFGCTVRYVLFTGEEQGLYGSAAYAQMVANNGDNIAGVLNMDMIGYNSDANLAFELHTRPGNAADLAIANLFADVVSAYNLPLTPQIVQDGESASDHASFWTYGFPAILAIEDYQDFTPYYHTIDDQLETLDLDYFTAAIKAAVGTMGHMSCLLEEEGGLSGQVSAAAGGLPVEGAVISADSGLQSYTVLSGVDGGYQVVLPPGTYTVTVQADGYLPAAQSGVTINAGRLTSLDVSLDAFPIYTLSGFVRDVTSCDPLSATVSVLNYPISPTQTLPATGAYTLTLPAGVYTLQVESPGYETALRQVDLAGNLQVDFAMHPLCVAVGGVDWSHSALPVLGAPVVFTAIAITGTLPLTYTWDFGDNSLPVSGPGYATVDHIYQGVSTTTTYTVGLTVVNPCTPPVVHEKPLVVAARLLYLPVFRR